MDPWWRRTLTARGLLRGALAFASDSLQVGVDPRTDASPAGAYDDDDVEVGVVLAADGPRAYRSVPGVSPFEGPCHAERQGDTTRYLVTVPWDCLGMAPRPGIALGLNLILNDDDGNGRSYWMGLSPGIGEGKRPWVFRDLVLGE